MKSYQCLIEYSDKFISINSRDKYFGWCFTCNKIQKMSSSRPLIKYLFWVSFIVAEQMVLSSFMNLNYIYE